MANLRLTDTQSVILAAAGARDSGLVLPLPKSLRINRGTQTIILRGLLNKDLIAARTALPDEDAWERDEDGTRTALIITDAGLKAIGINLASSDSTAGASAKLRPKGRASIGLGKDEPKAKRGTSAKGDTVAPSVEPAPHTKLGVLIAALRRKKGATISDLMDATGWQAHSVRGAISGALKKRLKLDVTSEAVDARGRVYRIGGQPA